MKKKKIIATFNECIVAREGPYICGTTQCGKTVCAHPKDVERGFMLFTKYRVTLSDESLLVPYIGRCERVSITRRCFTSTWFESLRLETLRRKIAFHAFHKEFEVVEAIETLEGISAHRLLAL